MSWLRGLIVAGVRNPVYANALMICILAGGIVSARTLVTETYPEFSVDRVKIEVVYPGAGPREVEQGVTMKVESALEGMPGVKKFWSRAVENSALVMIELRDDVAEPELLMLDVKDRLDRITTFPPEVERPIVSEFVVRTRVVNLALYGDASERSLKELATEVKRELLATGQVSQIELTGVRDYEVSIEMSREALLRYGLSLEEVRAVVARNCLDLPAGALNTDHEEFTIRTTGQRQTARDFEDLALLARPDGTLIRLGQVARVRDGFEESDRAGRFEGMPAVLLSIYKTPEEDTPTVARAVRGYVEQKRGQLPDRLHITTWGDTSREVSGRIDMLISNGTLGILLVVLVLSLFLDFRVSLYVALGVPVSFAGALIVMHFLGQTLNMITLFGLIMVTGIIVDDAIVIADSFRARVARGDAPALAAVTGPEEVALPVLASSATTVIAFAPLLFVVGVMGKLIAVLPVVVIAAIVFSAIEAFCILPSHLQHCLPGGQRGGRLAAFARAVRERVDAWMEAGLRLVYRPVIRSALRARVLPISLALAGLSITIGLVAGDRLPFTLLPEVDGDMLRARVHFPLGVPVSRTAEAARRIEEAAERLNQPGVLAHSGKGDLVARTCTLVGEWSGLSDGQQGSHCCEVLVELLPSEERRLNGSAILAAWAEQVGRIEGAVAVSLDRAEPGPTEKPLEVRLLSDDLEALSRAADDVAGRLSRFAGVSNIEHDLVPGKREIRIRLKPLARTLGVTVDDLARGLRSGFHGGEAVRIQRDQEEVRVQVRFPENQRRNISDIENLHVAGPQGEEIPFREVAEFDIERGYASVVRQAGQRRVRVLADVDERLANAEQILASFEASYLHDLSSVHPGVTYLLEGQHAQMVESLHSLFWGLGLALVGIYAVLAAMLGSYSQPIIIMAAVPLGFVGAALGHLVTGYDLTIMSVFGMVALSGIVVNDALVLLDAVQRRIGEGAPVMDAVRAAGENRFRAVMLTSVTTIAGLAPLLLERSTQAQTLIPMAVSLVFGLAMATVLILVVVPALYLALNDVRRLARWLRRGGPFPSAEAVEQLRPNPAA